MTWKSLKDKAFKLWVDYSEWSAMFFKLRLLTRRKIGEFNSDYETRNPKGYRLVFHDHFEFPKLDKDYWRVGQRWGKIHPNQKYQYSDKSCVNITDSGLVLTNKYLPEKGTQWVGQEDEFDYDIDHAHGEIEAHRMFLYGIFELRAIVPREDNVVTAFWLYGGDKKEIDGFEFFPKDDHKNSKGQLITVHWASQFDLTVPKKKYMSPKEYRLPLSITKQMNTYTMIWLPNKLEFLFNGEVIRRITNKKVLATLNEPMSLVLGNGFVESPGRGNKDIPPSPYVIRSFKYWEMI